MYNGMQKIEAVISHIESRLTDNISCGELARITALSEYEFRRIFAFIVGIPPAEYIRKRRLSSAAEELKAGMGSVSEIGTKYGYDSASSFTRAFKELFGVSPMEARSHEVKISVFTRPRFEFSVKDSDAVSYTEIEEKPFVIHGISGSSPLSDTCCCESVWAKYEESDNSDSDGELCAAYYNGDTDVICHIGAKLEVSERTDGDVLIDGGKWLCFDVSADAAEREINDLYERILFSFLPSGIYMRDDDRPNVEIFNDDGSFTVMIPVVYK